HPQGQPGIDRRLAGDRKPRAKHRQHEKKLHSPLSEKNGRAWAAGLAHASRSSAAAHSTSPSSFVKSCPSYWEEPGSLPSGSSVSSFSSSSQSLRWLIVG